MALQPLHHPSGDLAPNGLTLQDQRRIQAALDGSTSANTRRAYAQAWRRFEVWIKQRGPGHPLPATPELVAAFLAELAEEATALTPRGKEVATLRLTKSALAAVHRSTGHQDPTDNEGVRKVMAGIARANGRPQRQAKPLTETALAAVKATAKLPPAAPGPGTVGKERPGRRAPRTGGRRAAVGAEGWVAPPVGSRGAPLGRPGAAGGRLSPSPCPEIQDGSGGRGRGPVHRPRGHPCPAGDHARGYSRRGPRQAGL